MYTVLYSFQRKKNKPIEENVRCWINARLVNPPWCHCSSLSFFKVPLILCRKPLSFLSQAPKMACLNPRLHFSLPCPFGECPGCWVVPWQIWSILVFLFLLKTFNYVKFSSKVPLVAYISTYLLPRLRAGFSHRWAIRISQFSAI